MVTIRQERPVDEKAREALLDRAYGNERHGKPSAKLRNGRLPAEGLAGGDWSRAGIPGARARGSGRTVRRYPEPACDGQPKMLHRPRLRLREPHVRLRPRGVFREQPGVGGGPTPGPTAVISPEPSDKGITFALVPLP